MKPLRLVLVHGFLGSAQNWAPVVKRLQDRVQSGELPPDSEFLALDLLGHGAKVGAKNLTEEAMTQDLAQSIPWPEFFALGHSFGLRPLLRLAARSPERLRALVVEDASPELSETGFREIERILVETPVPFPTREAARAYFQKTYGESSAMSRFLMAQIRETSPGEHAWRFDAAALRRILQAAYEEPLWKEWKAYQGPAALIYGDRSRSMNPGRVEECIERHPGLVTIQISSSGHWVHAEQLDQFVDALCKVIKLWL